MKNICVGNLKSKKCLGKHRCLVVKPDDNQTLVLGFHLRAQELPALCRHGKKSFPAA